jgi:hypothetical protein
MTSRFNSLKQAIIQADKRKLAFRTYAGIGMLGTGSIIGLAVNDCLEKEAKFARTTKISYADYPEKRPDLLMFGLTTALYALPMAVVAGVMWPVILVTAFFRDY